MPQIPKNCKNCGSSEQAGTSICEADDIHVPVKVMIELVIRGIHCDAPKTNSQREENLSHCIEPHLCIQHFFPLWGEKKGDTVPCSRQCDCSYEQYNQYNVGEDCQNVRCLATALDSYSKIKLLVKRSLKNVFSRTLDCSEKYYDPRNGQQADQVGYRGPNTIIQIGKFLNHLFAVTKINALILKVHSGGK